MASSDRCRREVTEERRRGGRHRVDTANATTKFTFGYGLLRTLYRPIKVLTTPPLQGGKVEKKKGMQEAASERRQWEGRGWDIIRACKLVKDFARPLPLFHVVGEAAFNPNVSKNLISLYFI